MFNWFLPSVPGKDRNKGVRGVLVRLGPSWLASPIRRIAQAGFFALFVWLFVYVCWPYTAQPDFGGADDAIAEGAEDAAAGDVGLASDAWPSHYTDDFQRKAVVRPDLFLLMDPVVGLSASIASRSWLPAMTWGAIALAIGLLIPRYFCGYVCPMGTIIDFFDWLLWRHIRVLRIKHDGPWVHTKYGVLAFVVGSSAIGVMTAGYVAAIPVVTRAFVYIVSPLELGFVRSWHQVPDFDSGRYVSIGLFFAIMALGLLRPRFWCRYVCPSGALYSLAAMFRLADRRVNVDCVKCGKCHDACPYDAIRPDDYSTRGADCTFCQTCGGACPVTSIEFTVRFAGGNDAAAAGNRAKKSPDAADGGSETCDSGVKGDVEGKSDASVNMIPVRRRHFLESGLVSIAGLSLGGVIGGTASGFTDDDGDVVTGTESLVRPPGSLPERVFLDQCIRCGQCIAVCPNNVLQPVDGCVSLRAIWTPAANFNWSGCEASCNLCTQVCPTGAIRPVTLDEKRRVRMGTAILDHDTCLPYAGKEACQLCYDECTASGYDAIEFVRVGTEVDEQGIPIGDSGFLAPIVLPDLCVGCGLCQSRCNNVNHKTKHLLDSSAITVDATGDLSDRIATGSYIELRRQEQQELEAERHRREEELMEQMRQGSGNDEPGNDNDSGDSFLPDFLQ